MSKQEKKKESKELESVEKGRFISPFDEMDRWFDDFFHPGWMRPFRHNWPSWPDMEMPFKGRTPRVDVIDRDNEIVIHAELPGVNKEDLDVSLTENVINIRATTQHEKKEEKGQYYRREMSRGEFQRSVPLPVNVDAEKAKASFKDGIMELTLPKIESSKRKTIKVE